MFNDQSISNIAILNIHSQVRIDHLVILILIID